MNNFRLLSSVLALVFATAINAAVGDTFSDNSCQYRILTDSTVSFKGVDADVTNVTIPTPLSSATRLSKTWSSPKV